ncbi:MAG: hypothetical protein PVJ53_16500 [Desulfobacterales bacterium]|jgi:hypothetical protein
MEMYVIQEKKENRSNSVFYKGQIAYAVMPNGRKMALQACGEVKFILPNPDRKFDVYGHGAASGGLEKIEITGLTDMDLPRDDSRWLHRNHFEIVKLSRNGDVVGDGILAGQDYDEAMDRFLKYCVSISGR